jgi:hypothetical protein
MSTVLHRTTKEYHESANTPDYPIENWIINPDLSAVSGVPIKYWKITGDAVSEMNQTEKDTVDAAVPKLEVEHLHLTLPKEVVGAGASKAIVNDRPAISFQPSQDAYGAISFVWPNDLDSRAEIRICAQFIMDTSGTGSTVMLEAKVKKEGAGEDSSAPFSITDMVDVTINYTNPGDVFLDELILDAATFAKGNSIVLQVGRKGTDSSDDASVVTHLIAIEGVVYA